MAATLAAQEAGPTAETTEEALPTETNTPNTTATACYGTRYVYDETYPDGTRVDPGQAMAETWRLQNVGTCDPAVYPEATTRFHPTFAYEMIWNLIGAGIILWLARRFTKQLKPGVVFGA